MCQKYANVKIGRINNGTENNSNFHESIWIQIDKKQEKYVDEGKTVIIMMARTGFKFENKI